MANAIYLSYSGSSLWHCEWHMHMHVSKAQNQQPTRTADAHSQVGEVSWTEVFCSRWSARLPAEARSSNANQGGTCARLSSQRLTDISAHRAKEDAVDAWASRSHPPPPFCGISFLFFPCLSLLVEKLVVGDRARESSQQQQFGEFPPLCLSRIHQTCEDTIRS